MTLHNTKLHRLMKNYTALSNRFKAVSGVKSVPQNINVVPDQVQVVPSNPDNIDQVCDH